MIRLLMSLRQICQSIRSRLLMKGAYGIREQCVRSESKIICSQQVCFREIPILTNTHHLKRRQLGQTSKWAVLTTSKASQPPPCARKGASLALVLTMSDEN